MSAERVLKVMNEVLILEETYFHTQEIIIQFEVYHRCLSENNILKTFDSKKYYTCKF